jgi:hypothetical protein
MLFEENLQIIKNSNQSNGFDSICYFQNLYSVAWVIDISILTMYESSDCLMLYIIYLCP